MGKTFTTSRAVDGGKGTMISVFWLNKSIFLTVHFARDVGVHKLFPQFFILLQSLRCFNIQALGLLRRRHILRLLRGKSERTANSSHQDERHNKKDDGHLEFATNAPGSLPLSVPLCLPLLPLSSAPLLSRTGFLHKATWSRPPQASAVSLSVDRSWAGRST